MTTLLYLMACLMSPSPLINLAESRVISFLTYSVVVSPGNRAWFARAGGQNNFMRIYETLY